MSQSFLRRKKKKQENLLNDRRQNLLIYERGKDFFGIVIAFFFGNFLLHIESFLKKIAI